MKAGLNCGVRLVCFDLDGTLVDTALEITDAANRTLVDFGLPAQTLARVSRYIGAGTEQMMRRLLCDVTMVAGDPQAPPPIEQVLARMQVHYRALVGTRARPYFDAARTLDRLRGAGLHLACITNKEHEHAGAVLAATGLISRFDMLVGGDTLGCRKPDPAVLRHVLDAFGLAPDQAVHVGDSRTDIQLARAAGVAAWAVPWGYNAGVPVAVHRPERLFPSFGAIATALLGRSSSRDANRSERSVESWR